MRAKFKVLNHSTQIVTNNVKQEDGSFLEVKTEVKIVNLQSTVEENNPENDTFFSYGAQGSISLGTVSEEMSKLIDTDKEFYVDFTPVEK